MKSQSSRTGITEVTKMDRNTYYRTNAGYIRKQTASSPTTAEIIIRLLSYFYKKLEKALLSDGFAAGFCGVALLLIVGIVGGIEFGTLSLKSGFIFSSVLLSTVCIIVYKKNKE